jgi:serine/threonine protein kinase
MFEIADAANKSEWTPPRLFDGYRLLWPISHARRGTVYLGHDTVLDRPVIVHFFKLPEGPNRELLLSEARMAARLTHPNLVAIHRVGEVQTRLYLISEYGAGRTLEHLERPLPWHKSAGSSAASKQRTSACPPAGTFAQRHLTAQHRHVGERRGKAPSPGPFRDA